MNPPKPNTPEEQAALNMLWRMHVPLEGRLLVTGEVWHSTPVYTGKPNHALQFKTHQFRREPHDDSAV